MQYLMIFSILVLTNGGKYALIALRTCGRDTPGNNSGSHFWEVRIFCTLRLYTPPRTLYPRTCLQPPRSGRASAETLRIRYTAYHRTNSLPRFPPRCCPPRSSTRTPLCRRARRCRINSATPSRSPPSSAPWLPSSVRFKTKIRRMPQPLNWRPACRGCAGWPSRAMKAWEAHHEDLADHAAARGAAGVQRADEPSDASRISGLLRLRSAPGLAAGAGLRKAHRP